MKRNYDFEPKKAKNKVSIVVYILIGLFFTGICSILSYLVLKIGLNYNMCINSGNRGDYLSIFGTHCAVVFLTTSLMAMLSDRNRYIYWVEMVTTILIFPEYMSFLALAVYSISTITWAMMGFIISSGAIVVGSFFWGLVTVTILFSRMILVYYQNDKNKIDIEKYLLDKIDKNDYEKYITRLKEITYIKADNREFYDVYDNIKLLEKCILRMWENVPRNEQHIIQPIGFLEYTYVDILSDLALQYPNEMQEYIENQSDSNEKIKLLSYTIYPTLLNSYIRNERNDVFERALYKWSKIKEQTQYIIGYLTNFSIDNYKVVAEYYSKLFNIFNHEINIDDNFDMYISIIESIYLGNQENYDFIMQYKQNRYNICLYALDLYKIDNYPLEVLAVVSDIEQDKNIFIEFLSSILSNEIYRHRIGDESNKKDIEDNPVINRLVHELIKYKREKSFLFIDEIKKLIQDVDSAVYKNAGSDYNFYEDFEEFALDYALIVNKKELEKEDREHFSRKNEKIITILQSKLEDLNYKGRRVNK